MGGNSAKMVKRLHHSRDSESRHAGGYSICLPNIVCSIWLSVKSLINKCEVCNQVAFNFQTTRVYHLGDLTLPKPLNS